jgi:hypothetical protein
MSDFPPVDAFFIIVSMRKRCAKTMLPLNVNKGIM